MSHQIGDLVLGHTKGLGQIVGIRTDFFSKLPRYNINWFRSDTKHLYPDVDVKWFKEILKKYRKNGCIE